MSILPETIGKLIKPVVDNEGNVYALAEQGTLIPLSQETKETISFPGYPTEDRAYYFVRDPEVPLTKYLPRKPASIDSLVAKTAKSAVIATIKADDIGKYLPAGAKVDDIDYKGSDGSGNKYFLIFTEGIKTRCFVIVFSTKWKPTAITPISNVSSHTFVISHDGTIIQLVSDSAKVDNTFKVLKWMLKQ